MSERAKHGDTKTLNSKAAEVQHLPHGEQLVRPSISDSPEELRCSCRRSRQLGNRVLAVLPSYACQRVPRQARQNIIGLRIR